MRDIVLAERVYMLDGSGRVWSKTLDADLGDPWAPSGQQEGGC